MGGEAELTGRGGAAGGAEGGERGLELEPETSGDLYAAEGVREVPRTLRAAVEALDGAAMLRAAMGDDVIDHYVRAARWEVEANDRAVTDWDVMRGFERA